VFSLIGGTAALRAEFLRSLGSRLTERGLDLAVLPGESSHEPYLPSLLARLHDLVVIDGGKNLPFQRICLSCGEEGAGELSCAGCTIELVADFSLRLAARLDELVRRTPVWACVLIGGKSSRMGRPKHLLAGPDGRTWLERTMSLLRPLVDGLVVSGNGLLPESVAGTVRLADIPGVSGPLAGMLAACRWQPQVSWLVVACDMPEISAAAAEWLLAGRRAGCWGRVPRLPGSDHCEPLFAWYDCRAAQLFEMQAYAGKRRIGEIARHARIETPTVLEQLRAAFLNINTPDQLAAAKCGFDPT
jgi:glutamate dehydrogenase (NADP+)/cyclic pyranopterin phosphate synthase/molybdopterin-guanine dinucleotide biosynthesis protein A